MFCLVRSVYLLFYGYCLSCLAKKSFPTSRSKRYSSSVAYINVLNLTSATYVVMNLELSLRMVGGRNAITFFSMWYTSFLAPVLLCRLFFSH